MKILWRLFSFVIALLMITGIGIAAFPIRAVTIWINPEDKEPVKDYAYSFAVIGDTQYVNDRYPDKFQGIYDWILDNVDDKNIKFVFGLGDITDKSKKEEWLRAKAGIHSLDGKVEYSIVRGNHDGIATYNSAFPWAEYKDSFDGSFNRTMLNTYRMLTIGKIKYLLITLDFGASDKVLTWAGELCEEYSDHNVIITTHSYLYKDGTTVDANDQYAPTIYSKDNNNGDHMWDKLISQHENIVLVMSGHIPYDRIVVAQDEGKHGNVVTQMLIDPQDADLAYGGLGMVAMLYFSEDGRDVTVEYYSTIKEKYFRSDNQFTMTLDLIDMEETETTTTSSETESTSADTTDDIATTPIEAHHPADGVLVAIVVLAVAIVAAVVMAILKKRRNK